MKKKNLLMGTIFVFITMFVLYGCSSSTNYELDAPKINGSFAAEYNLIYWDPIPGADYYRIYGLEFEYDGLPGEDNPFPKDPRKLNQMGHTTETTYIHETTKDWVYAVRAFSNDGKSSDYSGLEFTLEWLD